MSDKLSWLSRGILGAAIAAVIAFAAAAPAAAGGNHCPPGSSSNNYCQVFCAPPYVVGQPLGTAIRRIIQANCSVGRIICTRAPGGSQPSRRDDSCGLWYWRGGRQWTAYRDVGKWRPARTSAKVRDTGRGTGPWDLGGIVIAQSPGPGGQYPAGTPINLVIEFHSGG